MESNSLMAPCVFSCKLAALISLAAKALPGSFFYRQTKAGWGWSGTVTPGAMRHRQCMKSGCWEETKAAELEVVTEDHGLKVHRGHRHKEDQLAEILRDESLDNSLGISFFSEERIEITSTTPVKPAVSGGLNREGEPASEEDWREMLNEVFHPK